VTRRPRARIFAPRLQGGFSTRVRLGLAAELRPRRVVLAKAEETDRVASLGKLVSAWNGRVGLMVETARGADVRL
jgi:hypothetical protein